jgi:hypothetical protein
MGLLDVVTNVLTVYKADTSDHREKLKGLTGAQKEMAQAELDGAVARNKQFDDWKSGLSKIGTAIGAVALAYQGIKEYGDRLDLEAAAGAVSIDKLSEAAMGLKTRMELLRYAAIYNNSAFKLTEEQMFTVQRAMFNLEERGRDANEVWSAMQALLTKGTVEALEGLIGPIDKTGLAFDENGDKLTNFSQKGELVTRVMRELTKVNQEAGPAQLDAADQVEAGVVKLKDAWSDLKVAIGSLVSALAPLIKALGSVLGLVGSIVDQARQGKRVDSNNFQSSPYAFLMTAAGLAPVINAGNDFKEWSSTVGDYNDQAGFGMDPRMWAMAKLRQQAFQKAQASGQEIEMPAMDVSRKRGGGGDSGPAFTINYERALSGQELLDAERKRVKAMLDANSQAISEAFGSGGFDTSSIDSIIERSTRGDRYAEYNSRKTNSKMESMFGKLEDIDLYKTAFDGLTGAVTSSLKAWIDGSESAGRAFKKFIGSAIENVGLQMAVEALKEGAYAIGSLASGNLAKASLHGTAAAKHAAGAVVALGIAKSMGGSSSASVPGGGSPGGGYGSGANTYARPNAGAVIVYGDPFAMDSPRNRQVQAQRIVNLALGGGNGVRAA